MSVVRLERAQSAGDGQVKGHLPVFASESPTRATEAQGALFAAHSAHLVLHYLASLPQVPLVRPPPPPLPPPPPPPPIAVFLLWTHITRTALCYVFDVTASALHFCILLLPSKSALPCCSPTLHSAAAIRCSTLLLSQLLPGTATFHCFTRLLHSLPALCACFAAVHTLLLSMLCCSPCLAALHAFLLSMICFCACFAAVHALLMHMSPASCCCPVCTRLHLHAGLSSRPGSGPRNGSMPLLVARRAGLDAGTWY